MRIEATEAERAAFKRAIEPLLKAERRQLDAVEWLMFFEALRDVPLRLIADGVVLMTRVRRRYPFGPADIREAAEQARQALLAAHPYRHCEACRDTNGWVTIRDAEGVDRVAKCGCFARYRAELLEFGITEKPVLQLAAGDEERAS